MHSLHNLFPHAGPLPHAWMKAMLLIESITGKGTAVLAGGALRDWGHVVPVKDLDIFVPFTPEAYDLLPVRMWREGWNQTQLIQPSCEGLNEVRSVMGFTKEGETEINVIFLDPEYDLAPLAVASRNDFGLCQIAAHLEDGEWRFEYTEAFLVDVMGESFTLIRTGDEARSLRRFERLQAKYPDHRLITPHLSSADRDLF